MRGLLDAGRRADDIVAVVRNAAKARTWPQKGVQVRVAAYETGPPWRRRWRGRPSVARLLERVSAGARAAPERHRRRALGRRATSRLYQRAEGEHLAACPAPEHRATEEYIAASGLTYTIVRNNWYTETTADGRDSAGTGPSSPRPSRPRGERRAPTTRRGRSPC